MTIFMIGFMTDLLITQQEERKSLKERLQSIQEATLTVQNSIGYIASLFESIRK